MFQLTNRPSSTRLPAWGGVVAAAGAPAKGVGSESVAPSEPVGIDAEIRFLTQLGQIDPLRRRKLIDVREQIRRGTYLSPDKLRVALQRLLRHP